MEHKSAIIIGGGLGGLFTGAILSKEGIDVTVIEKNATIGGGLQSFTRMGEVFDTGMHVIGGMQRGGNIRKICEYLGIMDKVRIADVDPECTDELYFAEDKKTYRFAKGRANFIKSLASYFPDQHEALCQYVDAIYRITNETDIFYLRPTDGYIPVHSDEFVMSADAFIAKYITDERLRSLVSYMNPLYSGRGDMTPAYVHAIISVLYIEGASRFVGGSQRFADTLGEYITQNGGKIIKGDGVSNVLCRDKEICGVRTKKGLEFTADYYICAIHPCTFIKLLDDPKVLPKAYRTRLDDIPNSFSAFTLNIKLKPETFRYINHSCYYMNRYDEVWNFGSCHNALNQQWPMGFLYMTPPEERQGEFSTKMIITSPMLWDEVKQWEDTYVGHRGEGYEAWKKACANKLLDKMEEVYPDFRSYIEDINIASPLTIRDYYGVKEGAMCGFSKDYKNLLQSQIPVITKAKNLLLTGQNCNLHGFCGVPLTAINTCEAILGQNYVINKIKGVDINPFTDGDIPGAMRRIANSPELSTLASFVFPGIDIEDVRRMLLSIHTIHDFQIKVMYHVNKQIIERTTNGFTYGGIENITKTQSFDYAQEPNSKTQELKNYLYVSNHRDIMLDASLLQLVFYLNGMETSEITFGANLMQGDIVIDIGKANKMFRVERPGSSPRDFYKASMKLSDYMRHTLLEKRQSIWIAQRNGRTKDGIDRTDQGIIKMFAMSRTDDKLKSISELNIVPVAISYEWESCDKLKALELYARNQGPYKKAPGEDLNSILTGITQQKGRVHIEICKPVTEDDLMPYASLNINDFHKQVARIIDERILSAYHNWPNNYIAYDILKECDTYASHYTDEEKATFISHLSWTEQYATTHDTAELRRIFLGIYANSVKQ